MPERKEARAALARLLPKRGAGAEIGVLRGDFSQILLAEAKPSLLHLIDPWRLAAQPGYEDALYSSRTTTQAELDAMYEGVCARFRQPIASGEILIHRARSEAALGRLADDSLDWVYLDGDHTRAAVLADLTLAARKIRIGGLIAGDDYGLGGWWDSGVLKAVHAFLHAQEARFVIACVLENQFSLRRAA